jgi:hypothetical protein
LCTGEAYQVGRRGGHDHRDLAEEVVAGLQEVWVGALMLEDGASDGSIGSCGL